MFKTTSTRRTIWTAAPVASLAWNQNFNTASWTTSTLKRWEVGIRNCTKEPIFEPINQIMSMWTICWIKPKILKRIPSIPADLIMIWFEIKCELLWVAKIVRKNLGRKKSCIHIKPPIGIFLLEKARFGKLISIPEIIISKLKLIVFWVTLVMATSFWIHRIRVLVLSSLNLCHLTRKRWFRTSLELIVLINKKWIHP